MAEEKKQVEEAVASAKTGEAEAKAAKEEKTAESASGAEAKAKPKAGVPKKTARKKPKRRLVTEGKAYIQASFNNTMISITDLNGSVLAWSSAGANGFKGPKKATPYAAQISAEKAIEKAKVYGIEKLHIVVKGAGNGREQAIRGLQSAGVNIESITDVTTIAHNGCRKKKTRRV